MPLKSISLHAIDRRPAHQVMTYHLLDENRAGGGTEAPQTNTILVVDDYPSLCEMAATMLRSAGYRVLTALSGESALQIAAKHPGESIDLLVTDYEMPRMRGDELARQLRHTRPNTRVLLMSSIAPRIAESLEFRLLPKPFSTQSLLSAVRSTLSLSEIR